MKITFKELVDDIKNSNRVLGRKIDNLYTREDYIMCELCNDTGIVRDYTYDHEGMVDGNEDVSCTCTYESADEDWSGASEDR